MYFPQGYFPNGYFARGYFPFTTRSHVFLDGKLLSGAFTDPKTANGYSAFTDPKTSSGYNASTDGKDQG